MAGRLRWLLVLCPLLVGSGCAMCCAPYDDYYPAVGGRWVRDNPTEGRVGSAFAPAGHRVERFGFDLPDAFAGQAQRFRRSP
jgi:hypothetical protein